MGAAWGERKNWIGGGGRELKESEDSEEEVQKDFLTAQWRETERDFDLLHS